MIFLQVLVIALMVILLTGWPVVAFAHYHWRRGFPVSRSLPLTIAPALAVLLIDALFGDGFAGPRHRYDWLGFLSFMVGVVWVALPYVLLLVWSLRAFNQRRTPQKISIHTPEA